MAESSSKPPSYETAIAEKGQHHNIAGPSAPSLIDSNDSSLSSSQPNERAPLLHSNGDEIDEAIVTIKKIIGVLGYVFSFCVVISIPMAMCILGKLDKRFD